ncbi:hypothetical protein VPH35_076876 [Triticum aestivum]
MEAMSASISRLCQMVHDAGLRPGTEERLQVVLEAARARGCLDDSFVSLFDEVLVGFLDKFTVVRKLADDLDVRLQPTRPGSAMPATLNGLYGDNLFDALVALRLPAVAPENVYLEVALAAQRLAQQDTIDIITHVYVQIVHKDYYMQEEDDRTLAFLDRRATLDGIVQKHVELAANAAAPHTSVGDPVH